MITVYATSKEGDGHVMVLGEYETWYEFAENFTLRVGMFAPDVVISFEETKEQDE